MSHTPVPPRYRLPRPPAPPRFGRPHMLAPIAPLREAAMDKRALPIQPMQPQPIIPAAGPGITASNWPPRRNS